MTYMWQNGKWIELTGLSVESFRAQCFKCNDIFDYCDETDATKWYNEHDCGTR